MVKKRPPEWALQSQCLGKHRFDDRGLTIKVSVQSARRGSLKPNVYRCKNCGGWHIGNSNGKK